jgi:hypothetical protein
MLLNTSKLPYSLHVLLIDDSVDVSDGRAYRPDKVVDDTYGRNLYLELFCNEVNNVSPLSLVPGKEYLLPSRRYIRTFLEIGS